MSSVKCHYCGAQVPLERARPRGGMWSGFMCGDCFSRKSVTAFIVVAAVSVVIFILTFAMQSSKGSRVRQTQIPAHGLASIGNVTYTQGEVTTSVQEMIPNFARQGQYESNWQEMLLEPLNLEKLQAAGFGYTHMLMDQQNVGSLDRQQTPETVTIMVKAKKQNYYFRVTQRNSAQ